MKRRVRYEDKIMEHSLIAYRAVSKWIIRTLQLDQMKRELLIYGSTSFYDNQTHNTMVHAYRDSDDRIQLHIKKLGEYDTTIDITSYLPELFKNE